MKGKSMDGNISDRDGRKRGGGVAGDASVSSNKKLNKPVAGYKDAGGSDKAPSAVYSGKAGKVDEDAKATRVKRKRGGKVMGDDMPKRMDRPGRKRGGRVGAEMSPLSSAANTSNAAGRSGVSDPRSGDAKG